MAKTAVNRKKAAQEFADKWCGKGYEKGESQVFWIELLLNVFGVENITDFIIFEDKVHLDHTSFIDAWIPSTHVMIEQKSCGKNLRRPIKQSDSSFLTPFQQAKRYSSELPYSSRPRWIVTCNFQEFLIYDMEKPQDEPEQILLENLAKDYERLQFLVDSKNTLISREEQVSLKAGELVGKLYDALIKEYINPDENSFRSLNILCVRIVFCLYAEDAGLFETRTSFEEYIKSFNLPDLRDGIIKLFKALDTKPENRDKYDLKLKAFPYVNGGLFAAEDIEIPNFTKEIVDILVDHCAPFDWSEISPTIFGAVFESTLNPETRRKGGMHYTSVENIHKVIDPLFLDDLRAEFKKIVEMSHGTSQKTKLEQLRNKIANLKFLDPACGSGNFLTETYISLRRLENEILKIIHGTQQFVGRGASPIKIKISQFYGIEINDFAVTVAKTALWIAESQMMKETEEIVDEDLDFLPLSTSATIVEGNALRMDWRYLHEEERIPTITAKRTNLIYPAEVHEREEKYETINLVTDEINIGKPKQKKTENHYDYIMGNPPFVGRRYREKEQQKDIAQFFKYKDIDYVACWYYKAAELIKGTKTKCALVSTNSITQGEQVPALWKPVFNEFNAQVDFAYRTFIWDSESTDKAHVHCVVIGFSCRHVRGSRAENNAVELTALRHIFTSDGKIIEAKNINGYLLDAPDIFIGNRSKPLCDVPPMKNGNVPLDGDALKIEAEDYPKFKDCPWIKQLMGGRELLHNEKRYVLWLVGVSPNQIKSNRKVYERVELCRKNRLSMKDPSTQKLAYAPSTFRDTNNPENYIALPMVSSENRSYIPMAYLHDDVIPTNQIQTIPDATLYHFGILNSSVHNAWMRAVCGRLESRYRYSKDIVYNNFPWCNPTDVQQAKIEKTAQAILDARAKYPGSSLADLYDETTMPPELRKAHKENDKAVLAAYGFDSKMSEAEIVAELFRMYEKLTEKR